MSEITVTIASNLDQKRFDHVLEQTVDLALASAMGNDSMIIVQTERRFDHLIKTISCAKADMLAYFISAYDERRSYA